MHLSRDRGLAYDGHSCVIEQSNTMTYEDRAEARRPSVGTKVLMVGFAVFAVLGSFWTIVKLGLGLVDQLLAAPVLAGNETG